MILKWATRVVLFIFAMFTLFGASACLLFGQCPSAANTTVSFTVTDTDGQAWVGGTVTANLYNPSQTQKPLCVANNHTFPLTVTATLDGTGHGSMTLTGNPGITPPNTRWIFTTQSQTSAPAAVSSPLLIQGATQDISGQIISTNTVVHAAPPRFQAIPGSYGYVPGETLPQPCVDGNQWFNVLTHQSLVCNGGSYIPPVAACTNAVVGTPGCATVDNVSLGIENTAQFFIKSIPPATLQSFLFADGHITLTPNNNCSGSATGDTCIGHTNLDQLDTANTHAVGNQINESGAANQVPGADVGNGTPSINFAAGFNSGTYGGTNLCIPTTVAAGQFVVFQWLAILNSTQTITSSIGNTYTVIDAPAGGPGGGWNAFTATGIVTNGGTDNICTTNGRGGQSLVFGGVSGVNAHGTGVVYSMGTSGGPFAVPVTSTIANAYILSLSLSNQSACSFTPLVGYSTVYDWQVALGVNYQGNNNSIIEVSPGTYTPSFSASGCQSSSAPMYVETLALQVSGSFIQTADLRDFESATSVLSNVDANGFMNPPQGAGNPTATPQLAPSSTAPVTVGGGTAYDTTHDYLLYYNKTHGWTGLVDKWNAATLLTGIFQPASTAPHVTLITSGICSTANTGFATCSFSVPLGVTYADTSYGIACSLQPPTTTTGGAVPVLFHYEVPLDTSHITITLQNADASGAGANTTPGITCITQHP